MSEQELRQKIIELIQTKNYHQIISTFSLEERIQLIDIVNGLTNLVNIEKDKDIFKSFFTQEEAIQLCKTYPLESNVCFVSIFCLPMEYKEKLLQTLDQDNQAYLVLITSLEDDSLKIKYLETIQNEWQRGYIISSFQQDQLKEKYLTQIQNERIKIIIIQSFQNDNLKIKYLDNFSNDKLKTGIIISFMQDELKISYLEKVTDERVQSEIIKSLRKDDLKIKYLDIIHSNIRKVSVITSFQEDILKIPYIKVFQDESLKKDIIKSFQKDDLKIKYLNEISSELDKLMIITTLQVEENFWNQLNLISNFQYIKDVIDHQELSEDTKVPTEMIKRYSQEYSIELEKLNTFILKFGYKVLKFLDSNEIINVLNLEENDFNKVMAIFEDKNLEIDQKRNHTILESLLNREFRILLSNDYSIFSTFEQLIEEKNSSKILNLLYHIGETLPLQNYFSTKEEIETFIIELLSKNKDSLNTLHQITECWIDKLKNDYVNTRMQSVNKELDLETKVVYDKNFITKKVIATTSIANLRILLENIDKNFLTKEQLELIENKNLLTEIIKFKKSPKEYGNNDIIKPYLKTFEQLFTILYQENKLKDPTNDPNAKKKVIGFPKKISKEFLLNIIKEWNVEKFKKRILSKEENYKDLLKYLDRYRFLGMGSTYDKLAEKSDLILDATTLSSLIENFPLIHKKLKEDVEEGNLKRINFINIIEYANAYGSSSYKYSLLFGKENYRFIISNPPNNASPATKNVRLNGSVEFVKKMYQRKFVTIPPMDKNLDIHNKKINVTVGNVTNMINLTYGERTGSCMRIGGAGDSLFRFCLENENGFHIRFTSPKTGQFISRVSGFRNGNTIFFNQLRHSTSSEYNDSDLVETCQEVAKILIEESKGSPYPIHNVVISNDYAMEKFQQNFKKQKLGVSSIKEGFDYFYVDVSEKPLLLATSNSNGELAKVELGPDKVTKYPVQRDKITSYNLEQEEKMISELAKIQIIDQLLKGIPFEECNYNIPIGITQCYLGEDWYLTIDSKGNMNTSIIENSCSLDKALEEINIVKEQILKKQRMVEENGKKTRT